MHLPVDDYLGSGCRAYFQNKIPRLTYGELKGDASDVSGPFFQGKGEKRQI